MVTLHSQQQSLLPTSEILEEGNGIRVVTGCSGPVNSGRNRLVDVSLTFIRKYRENNVGNEGRIKYEKCEWIGYSRAGN